MTQENEANYNEITKALAEAAGVEVMPSEDGKILFAIDDDLGVSIASADEDEAGCDVAIVSIVIGQAPDNADALRGLLEENYLGVGSANGAFSVEPDSGAVVLYRVFPLPMEADAFVEAFSRLAGAARAAKEQLANSEEEPITGMLV